MPLLDNLLTKLLPDDEAQYCACNAGSHSNSLNPKWCHTGFVGCSVFLTVMHVQALQLSDWMLLPLSH